MIHILKHGAALCGIDPPGSGRWPTGDTWIGFNDNENAADCPACLMALPLLDAAICGIDPRVPITIATRPEVVCVHCGAVERLGAFLEATRPGWEGRYCGIGCLLGAVMARVEKLEAARGDP